MRTYTKRDRWIVLLLLSVLFTTTTTSSVEAQSNSVDVVLSEQEGVKVAVLDSGVDYSKDIHVVKRKNFIPGEDGISILYEDSTGHGTSIAGKIGAIDNDIGITGVAPGVAIYSARILDANNEAPIERVIQAIQWAMEENVNIINISFGTRTDSEALHEAIRSAYEAGILIIAAAGNQGELEYPAAYEEVLAVGAVDAKGELCSFSPTTGKVRVVAQGDRLVSSGAFQGILVCSGTSIAAAQVTGAAAVLWEKDLTATSDMIRALLEFSANYGNDVKRSYGIVDLEYALMCYDSFRTMYATKGIAFIYESLRPNVNTPFQMDASNYVLGSWTRKDHVQLAENSAMNNDLLCVFKAGARANDILIPGMTSHPQWHGFWCKKDDAKQILEDCNYIASYIWLTKAALSFARSGSEVTTLIEPAAVYGMTSSDKEELFGMVNEEGVANVPWTELLKDYGVSDEHKRYYLYGMALHTVTDLFAHSSYYEQNGSYEHINHADGADMHDDPRYYMNRWDCAVTMGSIVIKNMVQENVGSLYDFLQVFQESYGRDQYTPFYLYRFARYAKQVDPMSYEQNATWFDRVSCERETEQ